MYIFPYFKTNTMDFHTKLNTARWHTNNSSLHNKWQLYELFSKEFISNFFQENNVDLKLLERGERQVSLYEICQTQLKEICCPLSSHWRMARGWRVWNDKVNEIRYLLLDCYFLMYYTFRLWASGLTKFRTNWSQGCDWEG